MLISIIVDKNNVITDYATLGKIEGGIELEVDKTPKNLWKKYYKLIDGKIILDEELKAEITTHLEKNV